MAPLAATAPAWLRPAIAWLAIGAAIAALAQLALPNGAPLYDGVPLIEPYRYLDPTNGHAGNPTSYSADVPVAGGRSPQITAATAENPPQAQLIAVAGVFTVASGSPTLHVAIVPVEPAAPLTGGLLSGNVYRISVTDASGQPVPIASGQRPTLAMRSAVPLAEAAIVRLENGSWRRLDTVSNVALSIYTAEVDGLGDFAVVDTTGGGPSTTSVVIAGTIAVVVFAVGAWAVRTWLRRRRPRPAPVRGRGRGRSQPPRRRR
jgi:hypothetical protein